MRLDDGPHDVQFVHPGPDDADRARAVAAIRQLDPQWTPPTAPLRLDGAQWLPDLRASGGRVLHIALDGEIPRALLRRIRLAEAAGKKLTVAFGTARVDLLILLALQEVDARIAAVDWRGRVRVRRYRSVADWVAGEEILLEATELQQLAGAQFEKALEDPTSVKGRLYEETLCLLFSQVSWLRVREHAYRNASEEIDLVLGVRADRRIAEMVKSTVAVATAKNERAATGSATVKYLKSQIANRKGRSSFGFLCSATTVSPDAQVEILRNSQQGDMLIVCLDGHDLRTLLEDARNLDLAMEQLIHRAIAA